MAAETLTIPQSSVLEGLADLHFATNRQLTRFAYARGCYTSVAAAAKTLFDRGYIDRTKRMHNPMEKIYYLKEKGRRYLEAYGRDRLPKVSRSIPHHWLFQEHTLAVNDVLLAAREYGRITGAALDRFITDRDLRHAPFVVQTTTGPAQYVPDAWFTLAERSFLLEVDRGTEEERFWRRKVEMIVAFSGAPVRERFGTRRFTVMVPVVPFDARTAAKRLAHLILWTERELTRLNKQAWGQIFLFAPCDAGTCPPEAYFHDAGWVAPFAPTPHALIEG